MGCCQSKVEPVIATCPVCDKCYDGTIISNLGAVLTKHLETDHNYQNGRVGDGPKGIVIECPTCSTYIAEPDSQSGVDIALKDLYDHITEDHIDNGFSCSLCDKIMKSDEFVMHLKQKHGYGIKQGITAAGIESDGDRPTLGGRPIPKVGDRVLCKWGDWQYFDSTILSYNEQRKEYYIEWDDQDPTYRDIPIEHLAINSPPLCDEIGLGSVVLFHQGRYGANADIGRLSGVRWHQGKIGKITTGADGVTLYSGRHTKTAEDGKWVTYKDYEDEFHNYKLEELRCAPNIFDILADSGENNSNTQCDIYLSYCSNNSINDIKNDLAAPHTNIGNYDDMVDPLTIKAELESHGYKVLSTIRNRHNELDLTKITSCIKNCKVFVCCISDQYATDDYCRMQMQYAKKTAGKSLIPVIVGEKSYQWQASVVGMLIAGELYIDFKDKSVYDEKIGNLASQVKNLIGDEVGSKDVVSAPASKLQDIFISYCWSNSNLSYQATEVKALYGNQHNDPRLIKKILAEKYNYNVWLDIEQLTSGQTSSMFEQITEGLLNSSVVCAFVSSQYAQSDNCKMEFQFAVKSLRKHFIPICVGDDMEWVSSMIGALVSGSGQDTVDMLRLSSDEDLMDKIDDIVERIKPHIKSAEKPKPNARAAAAEEDDDAPPSYSDEEGYTDDAADEGMNLRAPQPGDHVISFHFKHAYFTATILSFDKSTMSYHIQWDDGDPSGRNPKYNQVGLNEEPDEDDIGVGEQVFFPQGAYGGTAGNNTGGMRYHEGIVDSVEKIDGVSYFSGHHSKGDEDGKWVTYRGYQYTFEDMTVKELRIAPNAMDALLMANQLQGQ